MRRVRYTVAMSLDGYIAGPSGEHDWITRDPAVDFASFFASIDTVLMGRRTFEVASRRGIPGMQTYVFSRTLNARDFPGVTMVAADAAATVAALRSASGKDIWLMGGGVLFRSLLEAGLVDTVEVGVIPILLGRGIPLLPAASRSVRLDLTHSKQYPSGIVSLTYAVRPS